MTLRDYEEIYPKAGCDNCKLVWDTLSCIPKYVCPSCGMQLDDEVIACYEELYARRLDGESASQTKPSFVHKRDWALSIRVTLATLLISVLLVVSIPQIKVTTWSLAGCLIVTAASYLMSIEYKKVYL